MNKHPGRIDFSAQFGGRDAADAVLPHFKAMKAAAKGISIDDFPYRKLAFILRVDGSVHRYGFSGAGFPDIDKDGEYLSIDIGITEQERENLPSRISSAVLDSLPIIAAAIRSKGIDGFDANALRPQLILLCNRYADELR